MIELAYALNSLYILFSAVLVMWMAAGFTMLEAGMVRSKNVVEIITKNFGLYAIACLMYLLVGYRMMYGESSNGVLPDFGFGVGGEHENPAENDYSRLGDFFFQTVFVATCMSVISGAVAERIKLWMFLIFAVFMTGFIYPIQGMWKWGGGWLDTLGFLDFAGSGIVHLAGATAALAGVLLLGPRKGKYDKDGKPRAIPGSNIVLVGLGVWVLWMGWFGFNGGSQLKISTFEDAGAVAQILVNTNIAAVGGLLAVLILSKIFLRKTDLTLALNGALAGLVAITAEPLAATAMMAALIGAIGGVVAYLSILILDRYCKVDDPVGAISVHGSAGIWGLLAVPLTNSEASLGVQFIGAAAIFAFVFITSFVLWYLLKKVFGIRVSEQEEYEGSDIEECGLAAYPEFLKSGD